MSWFPLAFIILTVGSLPPASGSALRLKGSLPGVMDVESWRLPGGLWYLFVHFSLDPDSISGEVKLTLRVEGEGGAFDTTWTRTVPKTAIYFIDYMDAVARPGRYTLSLLAESDGRRGAGGTVLELGSDTGLSVSRPMIVNGFYEDTITAPFVRWGVGLLPSPERCVWGDTLYYYYEIYNLSEGLMYTVTEVVMTPERRVALRLGTRVREARGAVEVVARGVPVDQLPEGEYTLVVQVAVPSRGEVVQVEAPFAKRRSVQRVVIDPIYAFIDPIATPRELEEYYSLDDPQARADFLASFWAKRGEEFYREYRRRVMEADRLFKQVDRPGRYTDMGRIYIKYGPPDEITREEAPTGGKAYTKWVYYSPKQEFLFADPNNTGEYRLVYSTNPEEAPTRFYEPPTEGVIDPRTEEWYWPW